MEATADGPGTREGRFGSLEGVRSSVSSSRRSQAGGLAAEARTAEMPRVESVFGQPASSPSISQALELADLAAQGPSVTVLVEGETGVGKGWLAQRIHARSTRGSQRFVQVNSAALGGDLVESELFGHERGAFTGASTMKVGLVESAEKGTVCLDEVGDLPGSAQGHLLSFLDNHKFRRVGGTREISVDVRVIAATNLNLERAVEKGIFRQDLFFRLSVLVIRIPPLRERPDEILPLARHFLDQRRLRFDEVETRLSAVARDALLQHDWPGNVRELWNVLERALLLSRGEGIIDLQHLPERLSQRATYSWSASLELTSVRDAHVMRVLDQMNGNRTKAARVLGIGRSTLKRRLAELGGSGSK